MGKREWHLLSPQLPRVIYISFYIAEHHSSWSLEQAICPVTRMAISSQRQIVSDIRASFRLHLCQILTTCSSREALDSSGTSRRKGCTGNPFTDYKSMSN